MVEKNVAYSLSPTTTEKWVIVVRRGKEEKAIAKHYFDKKRLNCTKQLDKALIFKRECDAQKFWNQWENYDEELRFVKIAKRIATFEIL